MSTQPDTRPLTEDEEYDIAADAGEWLDALVRARGLAAPRHAMDRIADDLAGALARYGAKVVEPASEVHPIWHTDTSTWDLRCSRCGLVDLTEPSLVAASRASTEHETGHSLEDALLAPLGRLTSTGTFGAPVVKDAVSDD
jgi:hypothetical protein